MNSNQPRIDRRTVLRGVGVAMALPWLESFSVWGDDAGSRNLPQALPKRFAALFNHDPNYVLGRNTAKTRQSRDDV